jgi:hypothetical protein
LISILTGKLFGDNCYIRKELTEKLHDLVVTLIIRLKKNMRTRFTPINVSDTIMSKKNYIDKFGIQYFKK